MPAKTDRQFLVFKICDAYESGYGHGQKDDKLPNPYRVDSDEFYAYNIGYELGREKQINT